jgi:hypothetical protein
LAGEVKWIKLNLNGEYVLIVGNFGMATANASLEFQKTGTWYDYFGLKTYNVATTSQSIALLPGEYRIYSTRNFGNPLYTGIEDQVLLNDLNIWPNPTKDYISVLSTGNIRSVFIYSVLGAKVKEFQLSDSQNIENKLYIGDLNSGVYLLQAINKDGKVEVRKIIKRP